MTNKRHPMKVIRKSTALLLPLAVACGSNAVGPEATLPDAAEPTPPVPPGAELGPQALVVAVEDARTRVLPALGTSATEMLGEALIDLAAQLALGDPVTSRHAAAQANAGVERLVHSGALSPGHEPDVDVIRLALDAVRAELEGIE